MITHEQIVLFIIGLIGLIVHYLVKWDEAKKAKRKFKIKDKTPSVLIVVIVLALVAYLGEEIKDFFVATKISMAVLGYGGHSAILKLLDKKMPNDNI